MDDETLKKIISDETDKLWHKAFNEGIMAGWLAACVAIYEETKDFHNAKSYREFLRAKCNEAHNRLVVDKSDHNA